MCIFALSKLIAYFGCVYLHFEQFLSNFMCSNTVSWPATRLIGLMKEASVSTADWTNSSQFKDTCAQFGDNLMKPCHLLYASLVYELYFSAFLCVIYLLFELA